MTTEDKYNEKMCRLIWHDALQCSIKTLSWGIDFVRVKVIENGTEFHVHGLKITGNVRIQYVEGSDLFKVNIIPDDKKEKTIIIENVFLDKLVSVIDDNLGNCETHCGQQCKQIAQWINLNIKTTIKYHTRNT